jgi:hypothetical protein
MTALASGMSAMGIFVFGQRSVSRFPIVGLMVGHLQGMSAERFHLMHRVESILLACRTQQARPGVTGISESSVSGGTSCEVSQPNGVQSLASPYKDTFADSSRQFQLPFEQQPRTIKMLKKHDRCYRAGHLLHIKACRSLRSQSSPRCC